MPNVEHHRVGHTTESDSLSWHFCTNLDSFIKRNLILISYSVFDLQASDLAI